MKLRDAKLRSSCPEVFYKKGILRNFAKFTGKHLCQRLFFNKVSGAKAGVAVSNKYEIHLKKRIRCRKNLEGVTIGVLLKKAWKGKHRCFPVNFVKFPRAPFSQNSSGDCFCKQQVNEKNSFTYTPSCIFTLLSQNASFYQNASRLLLPKRLWKCESTIFFRKYKRKVVLLEKQSSGRALWKRCSQRPRHRCFPANFAKFLRRLPVAGSVICNLPVQLRFIQVNFLHTEYGLWSSLEYSFWQIN